MKKKILLFFGLIILSNIGIGQDNDMKGDFYDITTVRQIKITFEQSNWADLLDSMRIYGDGLLIGNIEIEGEKYENAGIRYRRTKSFKPGKKHNALHIKLDYINKNQNHEGYETFILSNAVRDPSMVREVLGYEIAGKYMPSPQANYAKVEINKENYGLFVNIEAVDDQFLKKHFGSSDNSFFKCTPTFSDNDKTPEGCKKNIYASLEYEPKANCYTRNFELKSKEGWDDLIELTKVLNEDIDKLQNVLNIDRALWMLAFNNVLVNLNSYSGANSQHYYLYKDGNGQFNTIISELNYSFGSFKSIGSGSDLQLKELQKLNPLLHIDNPTKPLISRLLQDPLIKKIYINHIRTIVYDNFENGYYEEQAKKLQSLIKPHLEEDQNKDYTIEEFEKSLNTTIGKRSKIPGIVELMSKRSKFLKKNAAVSVFPPVVKNVEVAKRAKFSNEMVNDFNILATVEKRAKRVVLYYRFDPTKKYQKAFMSDDGKNNDGESGDKVFGVTVKPGEGQNAIEYFILSENAAAASFTPDDYMFNPYTSNLEDLNK